MFNTLRTAIGRTALAALAALAIAAPVAAQDYPNQPIHLILGYGPGASTDLMARFSAEQVSKLIDQPIVVENRPGANSLMATRYVAQQPADGYTIFFSALTIATNTHAFKEPDYSLDDFVAIGPYASTGYTLFVNTKKSGAETLDDFIAYGHDNPGKLTVATLAPGSSPAIVAHRINNTAKFGWREIQFRSAADAMKAVVAGEVDAYTAAPSTAKSFMGDNPDLKVFAITGSARSTLFPDAPTFKEAGFTVPDAIIFGWLVPAGTPQPVVDKLRSLLEEAKADPANKAAVEKAGLVIVDGDYKAFEEELQGASERFLQDMKDLGLTAQ
jgi:tripartite-type tricarboxylate transporter receptor subunit TctC